jgi:hypothetical protein
MIASKFELLRPLVRPAGHFPEKAFHSEHLAKMEQFVGPLH